jgi:hypothetical protein
MRIRYIKLLGSLYFWVAPLRCAIFNESTSGLENPSFFLSIEFAVKSLGFYAYLLVSNL